jgi:hypothetical protein
MDRSGRYVACLVLGVALAAAMSRRGATPVATLATELASLNALQRWTSVEAKDCPAPYRHDSGSNVAKSLG